VSFRDGIVKWRRAAKMLRARKGIFPGSAGVPPAMELRRLGKIPAVPGKPASGQNLPANRCGLPHPPTPRAPEALDGVVRGVEAAEVIVEDEVGERDGHGDIETFDEVHASDWQEEDLSSLENALMNLGLLQACER